MQPNTEHTRRQADKTTLAVDENGFLLDPGLWTRDVARQLARNEFINELTDNHWLAIDAVREHFLKLGAPPLMRHLCKRLGLPTGEAQQLFSSCIQLWRIAGLPDPGEEARTYLN